MVAADQARRTPQADIREWEAWERRHPGTEHPGRTQARIARGVQARSADWDQGTRVFLRSPASVGEAGRRARAMQRHPAGNPGPSRDDDPDMMEEPQMIDMGNWRRGRKF
jgi:hypothetical protein